MKRVLLILDGTNEIDSALTEVQHICDPGDKLTVLAVAEKPEGEIIGREPGVTVTDPYTGGPVGGLAMRSGSDMPVFEAEDETEARVAGQLRDELDLRVGPATRDGVDIWTQAIVRNQPAHAVAEYARASHIEEVAVPRSSLDRLHELLSDENGDDVLDGNIAPVIVLPA